MLKFILFAVLFIYVIIKASNFIFGLLYKILGVRRPEGNGYFFNKKSQPKNGYYKKRPAGSNVDVEFTSNGQKKSGKNNSDDGEYVDYEEVK